MALLTKLRKPIAGYHQWAASELVGSGVVIDVIGSLGRSPSSVTVESVGGPTVLQLNIGSKVRSNQEYSNSWVPDAAFWHKPGVLEEVDQGYFQDEIVIETDSVQIWTENELRIEDIRVIQKAPGLKITVT